MQKASKILLTGGSGKLGTELKKYFPNIIAPSHSELDITKEIKNAPKVDLVIHAAAYTKVAEAERGQGKKDCFKVNVQGTENLVKAYEGTPFVFISSEYAIKPVNHYSGTKTIGELMVQLYAEAYLIIRTLFKPRPYPFDVAFSDQYTRGDYIDVIGELIAREIESWDGKTSKYSHVGTKRKTMYQLAKQTNPNVQPNSVKDIKNVKIPTDYK